MLNHIGITIRYPSDIINFYQNILGFEVVKEFEINQTLAKEIFHIDQAADGFLLKNEELYLEIFVVDKNRSANFDHICLDYVNREKIIASAQKAKYKCSIIPRNNFDLVFINDKSDNIFELKEK